MTIENIESTSIAVVKGVGEISKAADMMDIIADAIYSGEAKSLIVYKETFDESFFDLRSGLAGEILQKLVNYNVRVCIVGDFSGYSSKALRDFIFESNKGKQVNFLADEQQAVQALKAV